MGGWMFPFRTNAQPDRALWNPRRRHSPLWIPLDKRRSRSCQQELFIYTRTYVWRSKVYCSVREYIMMALSVQITKEWNSCMFVGLWQLLVKVMWLSVSVRPVSNMKPLQKHFIVISWCNLFFHLNATAYLNAGSLLRNTFRYLLQQNAWKLHFNMSKTLYVKNFIRCLDVVVLKLNFRSALGFFIVPILSFLEY